MKELLDALRANETRITPDLLTELEGDGVIVVDVTGGWELGFQEGDSALYVRKRIPSQKK